MIQLSPPALLATDLDGTLAVNGYISGHSRRAAKRLKASGIPILVITGRNHRSLNRVEGLWDIADAVLFSSGAGFCEQRDNPPQERGRLTAAEVIEIQHILDSGREDYCILDPIPGSHYFRYRRHRNPRENPDFDARMALYREWARPMDGSRRDAVQVLVIRPGNQSIPDRLLASLSRWSVFHGASPLDRHSTWLEIFPAGLNKGSALARLCRERGIPRGRVLALGNDHNDASMLAWAGHGRIVSDAPPELASRYKTLPPAGEGAFRAAVQEVLRILDQSETWETKRST